MKRYGILTSGGDAPGMNPTIRAVVRCGLYKNHKMYGIKNGFNGLMNDDMEDMNLSSVADIIHRGGTILGTSRADDYRTEEGFNRALDTIEKKKLNGIIVLGGDGSMKGARLLAKAGVPTVCIPCTIDNDLGYTDWSIGFFTAVETIVDAIGRIRDTSSSHRRANIVEVMGRNCGDLALYAGIAGGAESIIVPEVEFNLKEITDKIIHGKERGKRHHIILVTEYTHGPYSLALEIQGRTKVDTRVTVLGYIQRGGSPSMYDRIMGSMLGEEAINALDQGESSIALGFRKRDIQHLDIDSAINKEKIFDYELYESLKILSM